MPNLTYTRMVVDEVLRLYPAAWMISRTAVGDDEIGGYRIPAGLTVFLSPYVTHRRPELWPNPEGFAPERFALKAAADARASPTSPSGAAHACASATTSR